MKALKKIINIVLYAVVWSFGLILGWCPRFIWLILADILYLVLYKIFGYRKKVTRENLKMSFPEKSDWERRKIEMRFYLYLMDIFIETIAMAGISHMRMRRLIKFEENIDFENDCKKGSVIVAMAHYCSWEWCVSYASNTKSTLIPVYHTLASEWADKLFLNMRSRFGAKPVSMKMVGRRLIETKNQNIILALIADQTPPRLEKTKWTTFLNQDTMFFGGTETLALKYNMPVYFFDVDLVERGRYKGKFIKLYDPSEVVEPFEITKRYADYLESKIVNKPQFWMWSHRRWKHKKW